MNKDIILEDLGYKLICNLEDYIKTILKFEEILERGKNEKR